VSGNVSLYNETEKGSVYPTPVVGMVGVLEDVSRHATPAFKREGDIVVAIGKGWRTSLAGSEYLEIVHGKAAGRPPETDLAAEKEYSDLVRRLIADGLVDTAHDVSGGGEIVALTEMALAGGLGLHYEEVEAELLIDGDGGGRVDVGLFGENGISFLIVVPEEKWDELQRALSDVPYGSIACVGGDHIKIGDLIDVKLSELRKSYERDLFGATGGAEVSH
jgi:phosphoribosylformylglycinamidine (FGAM) synthase-like enzyme